MKEPFLYIIESIICSGLFLGIYRLCIMRFTEFRVSRFFLLLATIGACAIPLLQIPVWPSQATPITFPVLLGMSGNASEVEPSRVSGGNGWVLGVYFVGVAVMLIRMSLPLFRAMKLERKSQVMVHGAYSLVVSKDVQNAFSSLRTVYLPVFDDREEEKMVMAHEESHLRHFHIAERWLMELIKAVCWFNPFVWMASRNLIEVQEMEADADVLRQGFDMTAYRQMLLRHTMGWEEWVCAFSPVFTKKRLLAMTEKRNIQNKRMWILLPMLGLALCCFGFTMKPALLSDEVETESGIVISGRVVDEQTGEPIVGAVVIEVGSTKGTITSKTGEFRLSTEKGKELKFLMIDYETRIFKVDELGASEEIELSKTKE